VRGHQDQQKKESAIGKKVFQKDPLQARKELIKPNIEPKSTERVGVDGHSNFAPRQKPSKKKIAEEKSTTCKRLGEKNRRKRSEVKNKHKHTTHKDIN